MITLKTQTQEFFSDICDVIRLFLGDVQITEVQGEAAYEHTVTVKDGRIADLWSHGDVEQEIVMPVPVGSELEIKRARKRQVKMALYELMK